MKYKVVSAAFIAAIASAGSAYSREPGLISSLPAGATMGVPVAAPIPEGLHLSTSGAYYSSVVTDNDGKDSGLDADIFEVGVILSWAPGYDILGGQYRGYISVGGVRYDMSSAMPGDIMAGKGYGVTNLEIHPLDLSWQITEQSFLSTGFSVFAPTGRYELGKALNTGADFWTFAPSAAYSYLDPNWQLTAHLTYFYNTESREIDYHSGDEIMLNLTALHNFGSDLFVGPVAYWRKQITKDENNGNAYGGAIAGKSEQAAIGLAINKRVGLTQLSAMFTHDFKSRNAPKGSKFWLSFSLPLYKSQ